MASRGALVDGIAQLPPGPELASALSGLDLKTLSGYELTDVMAAWQRLESHAAAQKYAAMAELVHCPPGPQETPGERYAAVNEFSPCLVAFELHWTHEAADRHVHRALELTERLPAVHTALLDGQLDMPRVLVFLDQTGALDQQTARTVADLVLPAAATLTTGQLRDRLRRLVIKADPQAAANRRRRAIAERKVVAYPEGSDGTGGINAYGLPAERVAAAMERLDALARARKHTGDTRTMDQLRADTFLDLLDGTYQGPAPIARKGVIELSVQLSTLMGLNENPGDLSGWGPLLADIARQVAERHRHDATWRFKVHDSYGNLISDGTTTRRPPAAMAHYVRARNPHCVAPGCRRPATHCDLDHTVPYAHGGPTHPANLGPLCRRHHRAKHEAGWRVSQPTPGTLHWTSPHAHHYTVNPDPPEPDDHDP